jgi:hypothetical protein
MAARMKITNEQHPQEAKIAMRQLRLPFYWIAALTASTVVTISAGFVRFFQEASYIASIVAMMIMLAQLRFRFPGTPSGESVESKAAAEEPISKDSPSGGAETDPGEAGSCGKARITTTHTRTTRTTIERTETEETDIKFSRGK